MLGAALSLGAVFSVVDSYTRSLVQSVPSNNNTNAPLYLYLFWFFPIAHGAN